MQNRLWKTNKPNIKAVTLLTIATFLEQASTLDQQLDTDEAINNLIGFAVGAFAICICCCIWRHCRNCYNNAAVNVAAADNAIVAP